jgi:hypothetical protein
MEQPNSNTHVFSREQARQKVNLKETLDVEEDFFANIDRFGGAPGQAQDQRRDGVKRTPFEEVNTSVYLSLSLLCVCA